MEFRDACASGLVTKPGQTTCEGQSERYLPRCIMPENRAVDANGPVPQPERSRFLAFNRFQGIPMARPRARWYSPRVVGRAVKMNGCLIAVSPIATSAVYRAAGFGKRSR
jgi:hypothetical protein